MSRVDNTVSRYSKQMRFHLYTAEGKKRTTVSLHTTLARLMAIALGQQPESIEAHRAITRWLQQQFDQHMDTRHTGRQSISHFMQSYALELIVDKTLSRQYDDWLFEQDG
jgi:pyrroloquinoline quinone (PQQ) biosynthesis protein C